ncbi:amino acid ABC transporter substrate-binding protein [Thalassotalea sp. M1531]|uniref:Amino acid ABC transporter substrate-binding protein n=1 Tax=Thalassotalea algicola TaxID=2716224 RepID=A0A7Y0LB69_9GAMM|nr:transporter substrate-binding domain-containing protein [Thalassotalea algicola]NMP31211.1 amino acid ABC transporter substrate-binding protein [Thalassotalea algicola]
MKHLNNCSSSKLFCIALFLLLIVSLNARSEQLKVGVFDEHQLYLKTSKPYRIGWDILMHAAAKSDISITPVEDAWARSLSDLSSGKIDGVFGAMKSPERIQWAKFSKPLMLDSVHIFTYQDSLVNEINSIDKKHAAVGVSKGSVQHKMAEELGFENIYAILDRNALYKMLIAKRIDYLIFSDSFINLYCYKYTQSKAPNCLKPLTPSLTENFMYVMFDKSSAHLDVSINKINRAIEQMVTNDEVKAIYLANYPNEKAYNRWLKSWLLEN